MNLFDANDIVRHIDEAAAALQRERRAITQPFEPEGIVPREVRDVLNTYDAASEGLARARSATLRLTGTSQQEQQ